MSNILLAWNNRTDAGTLSGGSWLAALPLTNLQNRQVQKVARSANTATASTTFDINLGAPYNIGILALVVHNLSVTATVRVIGASDAAFSSVVYDSGTVQVWPSGVIPQALLNWEEDNFWLGTLSAQARAGYQSPYICQLANPATCQYWRVQISDTSNSDGYVQIGRLFMASYWQPTVNYAYGGGITYEDPTPYDTTLSGAEFFDIRSRYRICKFQLQYITGTEAYSYAMEMHRLAGISGEVLVMQDPADSSNITARSFVGRLRKIGEIPQTQPGAYSVNYEIKELL